jgi:hypothetical protein
VPGKNATVDQYIERFRGAYIASKPFDSTPSRLDIKQNNLFNANSPGQGDKIKQGLEPQLQQQRDNIPTPSRDFIKTNYKAAEGATNDALQTLQDSGAQLACGGKVHYAEGGGVQGLVEFAGGGTHEQNAYGGIPIGNGNSVEENETMVKLGKEDYVFSDRIGLYTK